jgi:predicted acylesterase/phospholipase RssA
MFGAYQAGVWKALHGKLTPDLVVGASIGALNGWLIAADCHPDELIAEWRRPEIGSLLRLRFPRSLRSGLIDRAGFESAVRNFAARFRPRTPFSVVLSELPSFRRITISSPSITWEHLCASCSVPLLMPQYKLDGRCYSDGGLISSVPIRTACSLGASRIVAVRILPRRAPLWVRAARAVLLGWTREARSESRPAGVVMIEPAPALGTYGQMAIWRRNLVDNWIERGFRDGQAALSLLD